MAAAAANPVLCLQDEATCSICLEYFRDPVSVECGHNFCRACINQSWRGIHTNFPCPHCRKVSRWKKLRPNRQLANMVELADQILRQADAAAQSMCSKHREPLKLFCEEHQRTICLVCRESWDHRFHTVVPVEETTQEYKLSLLTRLTQLRKEVEEIEKRKFNEEKNTEELKNEVGTERQKIASEFEGLRQVVSSQERLILKRLEEVEKTIDMAANETVTKLNEKLASLNKLIMEIEKNAIRPAVGLLQGFVEHSLSRDGDPRLQESVAVSALQKEGRSSRRQNAQKSIPGPSHMMNGFRVSFTLDQRTASPQLVISADLKKVKYIETRQTLPNDPERFNGKPCVLGSRRFTSGRHYWEVEVGGGIYWSVGVAKESVQRKGSFRVTPFDGIWAIGLLGMYVDQYWAFTAPDTPLAVKESPQRIGVFLNYEEDQLSFYNADSMEHIFTFTCCFNDKVLPFFCIGALGTEMSL